MNTRFMVLLLVLQLMAGGFVHASPVNMDSHHPGHSSAELGLRLSYDLIDRALAPYVGVAYERKFGRTANFAEQRGGETEEFFVVAGVRLMF